ncbi:hypothetical protein ACO0LF_27790 [Undibacterium sp. Di27W]|uniref:hypothetical protein n=1 Tax=Undibacterium sp. Di27W TaxID=3413036 RepID=UPI003BF16A1D
MTTPKIAPAMKKMRNASFEVRKLLMLVIIMLISKKTSLHDTEVISAKRDLYGSQPAPG